MPAKTLSIISSVLTAISVILIGLQEKIKLLSSAEEGVCAEKFSSETISIRLQNRLERNLQALFTK